MWPYQSVLGEYLYISMGFNMRSHQKLAYPAYTSLALVTLTSLLRAQHINMITKASWEFSLADQNKLAPAINRRVHFW